jgi:hypothetical protein
VAGLAACGSGSATVKPDPVNGSTPTGMVRFQWTEADAHFCDVLHGVMHGVDACRYELAWPSLPSYADECRGDQTYEAALAVGCFDGLDGRH